MMASRSERNLVKIWVINIGIFLLLFSVQLFYGKYGESVNVLKVISWVVAMLLPPMAVLFTLMYSRNVSKNITYLIQAKYYKTSRWLSIYYFVVFWSVILVTPFVSNIPFEFYAVSSVVLLPMQALLIINLCLLLATRQEIKTSK